MFELRDYKSKLNEPQRLDVNSVLKDKSGAIISYKYSGIITLTPEIGAVLGGTPDAKTTDFGNIGKCNSFRKLSWLD